MSLLNGQTAALPLRSFWELWTKDLKVSFPKKKVKEALSERWGIAERNVELRLCEDRFVHTTKDLAFLYSKFFIGFDLQTGFYFDEKAARLAEQKEEMENAALFGMAK